MKCPKCNNNSAKLVVSDDKMDILQKCWCGWLKVVQTKRENVVIKHIETPENITLPSPTSKVRQCLNVLASLERATSQEVADRLKTLDSKADNSVDRVSSMLISLLYRKLVEVVENGKHKKGGSTWVLTKEAKSLLGVK